MTLNADTGHLSVFELFRLGIGPSSSHTVGPMRAAGRFVGRLRDAGELPRVTALRVELYGSLAATGKGHGTDKAVLLGLEGDEPETVPSSRVDSVLATVTRRGALTLPGGPTIPFRRADDLVFLLGERKPLHPNALQIIATLDDGGQRAETYYSIGGGFVVTEQQLRDRRAEPGPPCPHPFGTAADLLVHCARHRMSISEVMRANEEASRSRPEVNRKLADIAQAMAEAIHAGCSATGVLPGPLRVPRRASAWHQALTAEDRVGDPLAVLDWVSLYALAVNEENAAGHRVVTAPTNGAAGVVPAVLTYYRRFVPGASDAGVGRFLLAAGAIGGLIKRNASIAGAEVGCQGEVGAACAMAAAGLTEVMGGGPLQVENAAEIAMEHNLGLTCDPVGGLVQIPCIERNAIAAVKAINASRMALRGDGRHTVSLDAVIATMRQTGLDMNSKYKETARGGLAVNIIEC